MIFLSYAREDGERANRIYSMINRNDRPVFYDKMSLTPGMDWREEIERSLEKCKLVLILCSRHTVEKEGFIQKEIRLALERSEMMPEGRIFIIPIRFDEADVPRYQWIDIKDETDFYWIENHVDLAWLQVSNATAEEKLDIELVSKEDIVMLMKGKNSDDQPIFAYLKLSINQLRAMKNAVIAKAKFLPSDFGKVLFSGDGEPSEEIQSIMSRQYGFFGSSFDEEQKRQQEEEQRRNKLVRDEFIRGYREAYLAIIGSGFDVPLIQPLDDFPEDSSPLREGIKKGMKEALKHLPKES
jgi:hypothetical protein